MRKKIKRILKRVFLLLHRALLPLGIIILPKHYYVPIADINTLRRTQDIWAKKSSLPGINGSVEAQLKLFKKICSDCRNEMEEVASLYHEESRRRSGPGYGYVEFLVLHAFIRYFKPKRVIEIGSGVSTAGILNAASRNFREGYNHNCQVTCIEPCPSPILKKRKDIELICQQVEQVDFKYFESLEDGDLLFIDSSHTVKPGGDVNFLVLEVLPRLENSVFVHFHDIFLPFDYHPNILNDLYQWCETSLLRAFLIHNDRSKLLFSLSMLHHEAESQLSEVIPGYRPLTIGSNGLLGTRNQSDRFFPTSAWLQLNVNKKLIHSEGIHLTPAPLG